MHLAMREVSIAVEGSILLQGFIRVEKVDCFTDFEKKLNEIVANEGSHETISFFAVFGEF